MTAEYGNYGSIQCLGEIQTGEQGKGVYNIVYNRECHQKEVARYKQQTRRGNGIVDDSDETDCWRRRTGGKRSVMPGVSRSNQYLNGCGQRIVRQTTHGSVTVWRKTQ